MTPQQCRAARAWLDWSQDDLAVAARVSLSTVRDFEKERRVPIANNLGAMKAALESNGVGFVFDGQGAASGITFARPLTDGAVDVI
jgi:DNA-binding XRE family transcriptional regulator